MNWVSIATTLFYIAWLITLLIVLWRIMRSSERNAKSNQDIAKMLMATSERNAQSAHVAAQAAQDAVTLLKEQHHVI